MPLSQSDRMIVAAKEGGYYATLCGKIFNKNGKEIVGNPLTNSKHLRVTLYANGVNKYGYCSVLKHRFIAYYFKGCSVFNSPLIRHLNDIADDNRINNLAAGTYKDNRGDIPFDKISGPAKANAHKLIERSRKLKDVDIISMRKIRKETGKSYNKIAEDFNISAMTAFRAINKQSWSNINEC